MLDGTISKTMRDLVNQHLNDFHAEEEKRKELLLSKYAKSGSVDPPGMYFGDLSDLRKESIKSLPKIVWDAAMEVLDAHKPSYYPGIADDIKQELNRYLSERLSIPYDFQRNGWPDPIGRNITNERSELERIRRSSLAMLHTKIDLFEAKIKPKEGGNMQEQPGITIGSMTNSFIAINSANANQVNLRINELQRLINAIKENLNQAVGITEVERKTHLNNVENLEKELSKTVPDKNFILKSLDSLTSVANKVGTIASSLEPFKALIAPLLS